jgi:hypothetical protein
MALFFSLWVLNSLSKGFGLGSKCEILWGRTTHLWAIHGKRKNRAWKARFYLMMIRLLHPGSFHHPRLAWLIVGSVTQGTGFHHWGCIVISWKWEYTDTYHRLVWGWCMSVYRNGIHVVAKTHGSHLEEATIWLWGHNINQAIVIHMWLKC